MGYSSIRPSVPQQSRRAGAVGAGIGIWSTYFPVVVYRKTSVIARVATRRFIVSPFTSPKISRVVTSPHYLRTIASICRLTFRKRQSGVYPAIALASRIVQACRGTIRYRKHLLIPRRVDRSLQPIPHSPPIAIVRPGDKKTPCEVICRCVPSPPSKSHLVVMRIDTFGSQPPIRWTWNRCRIRCKAGRYRSLQSTRHVLEQYCLPATAQAAPLQEHAEGKFVR